MVNIKGLNKAEVLKTLFNNSKTIGYNAQMIEAGLIDKAKEMTTDEAQAILDKMGKEKYFDYLNGKVMKLDLTSNEEFNEWGYDRDNGEGSALKAINSLRK